MTRYLVYVLIVLVSGSAHADAEIVALAQHKFDIARVALEDRIGVCERNERPLPSRLFESTGLTFDELQIGLSFLYRKAFSKCEGNTRGEFVIATAVYLATANHYGVEAGDASGYSSEMMFGHKWLEIELEAQYLALPKAKREVLESIPELFRPFDLVATIESLSRTTGSR